MPSNVIVLVQTRRQDCWNGAVVRVQASYLSSPLRPPGWASLPKICSCELDWKWTPGGWATWTGWLSYWCFISVSGMNPIKGPWFCSLFPFPGKHSVHKSSVCCLLSSHLWTYNKFFFKIHPSVVYEFHSSNPAGKGPRSLWLGMVLEVIGLSSIQVSVLLRSLNCS